MGFTKLDSGILQSSIMAEDPSTFKVWIAFLASCGPDGVAKVSSVFISSICHLSIDSVDLAIEILSKPDSRSRSINDDGKRIKRVDGGYYIINYLKYRSFNYSDNPESIRKREYRKKKKTTFPNPLSLKEKEKTEAEAEAECPGHVTDNVPLWKTNFEVYKNMVEEAKQKILNSPDIIQRRILSFFPQLDVLKSLELSIDRFWGTEAGWKNKKKRKSIVEIDMVETLIKNIDKNKVFVDRKQNQGEGGIVWKE